MLLATVRDGSVFELRAARLPTGWTELRIAIDGAVPSAPKLLVDDGRGFSDAGTLILPLPRDGRVEAVVELPREVRRLALDVGAASATSVDARTLGFVETAMRLA